MPWREDDEWKIVFPDEKVFIMKHHNWAFVAWDLAVDNGWINKNATLFHIDQHLDAATDGVEVPGALTKRGLYELSSITRGMYGTKGKFIGTDNFIWVGFARETIENIIFVSPEDMDEPFRTDTTLRDLYDYLSPERMDNAAGYPTENLDSLEDALKFKMLDIFTKEKSVILDLDLDYFAYHTLNETGHNDYKLRDIETIKNELNRIKSLYDWDLITVALSPEWYHIGGPENAQILLDLFLEVFGLDITQGKDWTTIDVN